MPCSAATDAVNLQVTHETKQVSSANDGRMATARTSDSISVVTVKKFPQALQRLRDLGKVPPQGQLAAPV
jgi:hypothetical protein